MNLNLNLNTDLHKLYGPLLKRLGLIYVLCLIGAIGYTVWFVINLLFSKADLDALSKSQDSSKSKQIQFNQKTLESLDKLVPAGSVPSGSSDSGRANPFAP